MDIVIFEPRIYVRKHILLILALLVISGATKADVVVPIARCIVQIERKGPGVGCVIPIGTAEETVQLSIHSHLLS